MILDLTTKELRIVLGEAHTTNPCQIVTSWSEVASTVFLPGNTNILSNGTTPVVVVGPPSMAGVSRDVREVRLFNNDTVPHTVTLQLFDGSTAWPIAPAKVTVAANGGFIYTPESGISVTNPSSAGITITDGTTTLSGVTELTLSGQTVSGSAPNAVISLAPRGYIDGCPLSTPSTTTFTTAAGQCTSSDNTTVMNLASALTKSTAGTWVAGNNQNGLDTGTLTANSWYHVYVIYDPASNVTDVLFSLSATSPSLPVGFTKFRRIGSLRVTGTSLLGIIQTGDRVDLIHPINVIGGTAFGVTTANSVVMFTPTGIITEAIFDILAFDSVGTNAILLVSNLATTDVAPSSTTGATVITASTAGTFGSSGGFREMTDTSAQVRMRTSTTTLALYVNSTGYIDRRGKA